MTDILIPIAWLFPYGRYITYGILATVAFLISYLIFRDLETSFSDAIITLDIVVGTFFAVLGGLCLVYGFELVRFRIV